MIDAIGKAIAQMSDPKFRSVLIKSILVSILAFAVTVIAVMELGDFIPRMEGDGFFTDFVNGLIAVLTGGAAFIIAGFGFPIVMSAVIGIFLDDIADAVEAKHYPSHSKARDVPLWSSIWDSVKFLGVIVLCNLVALPLYLIPVINLFVYYLLNGYLLSREFFQQVAIRHHDMSEVNKLRKIDGFELFLIGVAITFSLTIPIVNLIVPIIATAAMVHLYKNRAAKKTATAVDVV
ncbi:EI24 domain-containing protein [Sneathiella sp.]|uniref:EI24 domain-containing protein n=1 Tax=Sneathiella sp. TaxID=1964365 RepID=UPI0039E22BA3